VNVLHYTPELEWNKGGGQRAGAAAVGGGETVQKLENSGPASTPRVGQRGASRIPMI